MTRKDYEAIAGAVRAARLACASVQGPRSSERTAIDEVVNRLADAFTLDNPRFDRQRFARACQVQAGTLAVVPTS